MNSNLVGLLPWPLVGVTEMSTPDQMVQVCLDRQASGERRFGRVLGLIRALSVEFDGSSDRFLDVFNR